MFTTPPLGASVNVGLGRLGRVPCSRPKTIGRTSARRRRFRRSEAPTWARDIKEKKDIVEYDDATDQMVITRDIIFHGKSISVFAKGTMARQQVVTRTKRSVKLLTAEARKDLALLKSLRHTNIVPVLRISILAKDSPNLIGRPDVIVRFRSKYMGGSSLGDLIRAHGSLSEEAIRLYSVQICSGIEFLHRQGIIHGGLSCDTILLCDAGIVKLTGWAQMGTKQHPFPRDYDHSMFSYLAPEVFQMLAENYRNEYDDYDHGEPIVDTEFIGNALDEIGYRSFVADIGYSIDMWSFGCICLAMVSGQKPWKSIVHSRSPADIFESLREKFATLPGCEEKPGMASEVELQPPNHPNSVADAFDDLISKLLQWSPYHRLSAEEALQEPFLLNAGMNITQATSLGPWTEEETTREKVLPIIDAQLPYVDAQLADDPLVEATSSHSPRIPKSPFDSDANGETTLHLRSHLEMFQQIQASPIRPASPLSDRRLRKKHAQERARRATTKKERCLKKASEANYGPWWPTKGN